MPADSDAVYALIKLSITQVDFQNNSVSIDSDAEYALIKMIHDQAVSTDSDSDSDSDSEYALTKTAIDQADFKENSVVTVVPLTTQGIYRDQTVITITRLEVWR